MPSTAAMPLSTVMSSAGRALRRLAHDLGREPVAVLEAIRHQVVDVGTEGAQRLDPHGAGGGAVGVVVGDDEHASRARRSRRPAIARHRPHGRGAPERASAFSVVARSSSEVSAARSVEAREARLASRGHQPGTRSLVDGALADLRHGSPACGARAASASFAAGEYSAITVSRAAGSTSVTPPKRAAAESRRANHVSSRARAAWAQAPSSPPHVGAHEALVHDEDCAAAFELLEACRQRVRGDACERGESARERVRGMHASEGGIELRRRLAFAPEPQAVDRGPPLAFARRRSPRGSRAASAPR